MGEVKNQKKISLGTVALLVLVGIILLGLVGWLIYTLRLDKKGPSNPSVINSYQECKDSGGDIGESLPQQCFINGESFVDSEATIPAGDEYVGLTESEATQKADRESRQSRVVEREGEELVRDMSLIDGRLNLYIKDGKVYKVDVESTE